MIYYRTLNRPLLIQLLPVVLIGISAFFLSCAQENEKNRPSPLVKDSTIFQGIELKVQYSSPRVRERQIWGDLVPYYRVWRTGANEATTFECNEDLLVEGELLEAGKYALFTIPEPETWTVIFNADWNQWGAYGYEGTINKRGKDDVLRLKVSPTETSKFYERMEIIPREGSLLFRWEKLKFSLNLEKP